MRLEIIPENAQAIADLVSKATFELLPNTGNISELEFKQAETKALLSLGYQPAVYLRKMTAMWNEKPWCFKAFEYMHDEDEHYYL